MNFNRIRSIFNKFREQTLQCGLSNDAMDIICPFRGIIRTSSWQKGHELISFFIFLSNVAICFIHQVPDVFPFLKIQIMSGLMYPVIFQLYYLNYLPVIIPVNCKPVQAGKAEENHQHEKPTPKNDFVKQPGILFGEE